MTAAYGRWRSTMKCRTGETTNGSCNLTGCLQLCKLQRLKGPVCQIFKQDTWSMTKLISMYCELTLLWMYLQAVCWALTNTKIINRAKSDTLDLLMWDTATPGVLKTTRQQMLRHPHLPCGFCWIWLSRSVEEDTAAPAWPADWQWAWPSLQVGWQMSAWSCSGWWLSATSDLQSETQKRRPIHWSHAQGCNFLVSWDSWASTSPI